MTTKIKKKFTTHHDGTVTFYNGFSWERCGNIPTHVWDEFTPSECARANTAIYGLTVAEQRELRREQREDLAEDRKHCEEISQVERDARDNR